MLLKLQQTDIVIHPFSLFIHESFNLEMMRFKMSPTVSQTRQDLFCLFYNRRAWNCIYTELCSVSVTKEALKKSIEL